MSKKHKGHKNHNHSTGAEHASKSEAPAAVAAAAEESGPGVREKLTHAKDAVVDAVTHPQATLTSVKDWAQGAAETVGETVSETLHKVQDALGTAKDSAREWTAAAAETVGDKLTHAKEAVGSALSKSESTKESADGGGDHSACSKDQEKDEPVVSSKAH